jgi:hypothetical protein rflaF_19778
MRTKFKISCIIIAALNILTITAAIILTAVGNSMAKSQSYNYAAQRWGGKNGDYSQISCFFSDDSGFTDESVSAVRSQIMSELKNVSITPEEGKTLVPDAYSASLGPATIRCDISGYSEAELTAVGGDFFAFRNFKLLDGAFFSKDDIMQDGAVIDKNLAWSLYGSDKISGMNIYINGVKFYIAGVIDLPQTDAEKETAGKSPRAYISYDMASQINGGGSYSSSSDIPDNAPESGFRRVSCYECIIPDPVENFAYKTVKTILGEPYKGKVSIINNSDRFEPEKRAKAFKNLSDLAVRKDGIFYPYWENASRITEFRLSYIYSARKWLLAIPVMTALWLAFLGMRFLRRKKPYMKRAVGRFSDKVRVSVSHKLHKNKTTD